MSSPRNRSKFFDGGGNIDTDALFKAYEEQGNEEDATVEVTFTISKNLNRRLDSYLATRIPFLSRTSIKRLVEEELVTINGRVPKGSTKIHQDDVINVILPPPPSCELPPEDIPLKVIYEDHDLIVINKEDDIILMYFC